MNPSQYGSRLKAKRRHAAAKRAGVWVCWFCGRKIALANVSGHLERTHKGIVSAGVVADLVRTVRGE
jgi:hypothetical protein